MGKIVLDNGGMQIKGGKWAKEDFRKRWQVMLKWESFHKTKESGELLKINLQIEIRVTCRLKKTKKSQVSMIWYNSPIRKTYIISCYFNMCANPQILQDYWPCEKRETMKAFLTNSTNSGQRCELRNVKSRGERMMAGKKGWLLLRLMTGQKRRVLESWT